MVAPGALEGLRDDIRHGDLVAGDGGRLGDAAAHGTGADDDDLLDVHAVLLVRCVAGSAGLLDLDGHGDGLAAAETQCAQAPALLALPQGVDAG